MTGAATASRSRPCGRSRCPTKDATLGPVPLGGAGKPEADRDRLSNILRAFNDQFANIEWKDADKIREVSSQEIPGKVAADKA